MSQENGINPKQHMENIFFEIHSDMPRQGPGDFESTRRAFSALNNLPNNPKILDVGCGPGKQTLDLAELSTGVIYAVDNHQPFIDQLQQQAESLQLGNRIFPQNGDMFNLHFSPAEFDVMWSEGAIYIIGFEKGLREWNRFIKDGGYVSVTELSWLNTNTPAELKEFWTQEYPAIQNVESNLEIVKNAGYKVIDYFSIPESAWWDDYYNPLQKRIQLLREKYEEDEVAEQVFALEEKEIDLYRKYSDFYGYVFYVLKK